jgi:hypothetical protein
MRNKERSGPGIMNSDVEATDLSAEDAVADAAEDGGAADLAASRAWADIQQ